MVSSIHPGAFKVSLHDARAKDNAKPYLLNFRDLQFPQWVQRQSDQAEIDDDFDRGSHAVERIRIEAMPVPFTRPIIRDRRAVEDRSHQECEHLHYDESHEDSEPKTDRANEQPLIEQQYRQLGQRVAEGEEWSQCIDPFKHWRKIEFEFLLAQEGIIRIWVADR